VPGAAAAWASHFASHAATEDAGSLPEIGLAFWHVVVSPSYLRAEAPAQQRATAIAARAPIVRCAGVSVTRRRKFTRASEYIIQP
jgi:hypothetical protein